jgi:repressor LexA
MSAVTKRQHEVLEFIKNFIADKGWSPSLQEVANGVGLSSLGTVHKHIANLKAKGFLMQTGGQDRSLEVLDPAKPSRFKLVDPEHLWDRDLECFWVKEVIKT